MYKKSRGYVDSMFILDVLVSVFMFIIGLILGFSIGNASGQQSLLKKREIAYVLERSDHSRYIDYQSFPFIPKDKIVGYYEVKFIEENK